MASIHCPFWMGQFTLGVFVSTMIHGAYDLCLNESLGETDWFMISLLIAAICLGINICNYFFMNKARNNPYYTDPLFYEGENDLSDAEMANGE